MHKLGHGPLFTYASVTLSTSWMAAAVHPRVCTVGWVGEGPALAGGFSRVHKREEIGRVSGLLSLAVQRVGPENGWQ